MIAQNKIVVDKTEYINRMLESGKIFFFLSRPRRFGKSFLIDVMNEFFNGESSLFIGDTYINKKRPSYSWPKYPVIRLDFAAGISYFTVEEFRMGVVMQLKEVAESYNVHCITESTSVELALRTLIRTLKSENGSEVVILIDEYDVPYAASYGSPSAAEILVALQSFFRTLKGQFMDIRLLFFTGASRIAISEFMTSITAQDLSLMPEYAGIVGFTEEELDRHFESAVHRVMKVQHKSREDVRDEMRLYHDGFQFASTAERVYNPCSVISYLETNGTDKLFFTQSGGLSTLLMKKFLQFPKDVYDYISNYATSRIKPEGFNKSLIVPKSILSGKVNAAEETYESLLAILYNGGYFSIDRQHNVSGLNEPHYILRFSNVEVEQDYIQRLSAILLKTHKRELQQRTEEMRAALESCNWATFISRLESIFAATPYFSYSDKQMNEAMFQFQLHIIMFQAKYNPILEVTTSSGRADVAITETGRVYIMETKLMTNDENPVAQCRDKYLKRFMNYQQDIFCIGLKFSQTAHIPKWGVAHFSNNGTLLNEHEPIKLSNWKVSESDETASEGISDAGLINLLTTTGAASIFEEEEYKDVLTLNKFTEFISKCVKPKDAPTIVKEYTEDISGLIKLLDKVYEKVKYRKFKVRITRIRNALNPLSKKTPQ